MDEDKAEYNIMVQLDKLCVKNWDLELKVHILLWLNEHVQQTNSHQKHPVKMMLMCEDEQLLFDAYRELAACSDNCVLICQYNTQV